MYNKNHHCKGTCVNGIVESRDETLAILSHTYIH